MGGHCSPSNAVVDYKVRNGCLVPIPIGTG
jgi:hypothetical protein